MKLNVKDFLFGMYITTVIEFIFFPVFSNVTRIFLVPLALYSIWIFIDLKIERKITI